MSNVRSQIFQNITQKVSSRAKLKSSNCDNESEAHHGDQEEICALKPLNLCSGNCQAVPEDIASLSYVNCGLCEQWFHFKCLGLPEGKVNSIRGLFFCSRCMQVFRDMRSLVVQNQEKDRRVEMLERLIVDFSADYKALRKQLSDLAKNGRKVLASSVIKVEAEDDIERSSRDCRCSTVDGEVDPIDQALLLQSCEKLKKANEEMKNMILREKNKFSNIAATASSKVIPTKTASSVSSSERTAVRSGDFRTESQQSKGSSSSKRGSERSSRKRQHHTSSESDKDKSSDNDSSNSLDSDDSEFIGGCKRRALRMSLRRKKQNSEHYRQKYKDFIYRFPKRNVPQRNYNEDPALDGNANVSDDDDDGGRKSRTSLREGASKNRNARRIDSDSSSDGEKGVSNHERTLSNVGGSAATGSECNVADIRRPSPVVKNSKGQKTLLVKDNILANIKTEPLDVGYGVGNSFSANDIVISNVEGAVKSHFSLLPNDDNGIASTQDQLEFYNEQVVEKAKSVYCQLCQKSYPGSCEIHGFVRFVPDSTKSSSGSCFYADNTVPAGLRLKVTGGIWTQAKFHRGTVFGPVMGMQYEDHLFKDCSNKYCWHIFSKDDPFRHIDGRNIDKANWMRYIRRAVRDEEANLVAFQFDDKIYFRLISTVENEQQLVVRYEDEREERFVSFKPAQESTPPIDATSDAATNVVEHDQRLSAASLLLHCRHCDFSTNTNSSLLNHISEHTSERPFQCNLCDLGFKMVFHLRRHSRVVHQVEPKYTCRICLEWFTNVNKLQDHQQIHHLGPFFCSTCDKRFFYETSLLFHQAIAPDHGSSKCKDCTKTFSSDIAFYNHECTNQNKTFYPCRFCNRKLGSQQNLEWHIQRYHETKYTHILSNWNSPGDENKDGRTVNMLETPASLNGRMNEIDVVTLDEDENLNGSVEPALFPMESSNKTGTFEDAEWAEPSEVPYSKFHDGDIDISGAKILACNQQMDLTLNRHQPNKLARGSVSIGNRNINSKLLPPCNWCNFVAPNFELMKDHLFNHYLDEPSNHTKNDGMFRCKSCVYATGRDNYFKTHLLNHARKIYFTGLTGQILPSDMAATKESLQTLTPSLPPNLPPYACQRCNLTFAGFAQKERHMIRRHIERKLSFKLRKPFKCNLCRRRRFSTRRHLTHHSRKMHPKDVVYSCEDCSKRFPYAQSRDCHIRRKHKQTSQERPIDDGAVAKTVECGLDFLPEVAPNEKQPSIDVSGFSSIITEHPEPRCATQEAVIIQQVVDEILSATVLECKRFEKGTEKSVTLDSLIVSSTQMASGESSIPPNLELAAECSAICAEASNAIVDQHELDVPIACDKIIDNSSCLVPPATDEPHQQVTPNSSCGALVKKPITKKKTKKTFPCLKCRRVYICKRLYDIHVATVHVAKPLHVCQECNTTFCRRTSLKVHENSTRIIPLLCYICGVRMHYHCHLMTHIRIQTPLGSNVDSILMEPHNSNGNDLTIQQLMNITIDKMMNSTTDDDKRVNQGRSASRTLENEVDQGLQDIVGDQAVCITSGSSDKSDTWPPEWNIPLSSYGENHVFEDDDYLFCDDCDEKFVAGCTVHGPLKWIHDTEVQDGESQRALKSIPKGFYVEESGLKNAGLGVWANARVQRGTVFGPYKGVITYESHETCQSDYCWHLAPRGSMWRKCVVTLCHFCRNFKLGCHDVCQGTEGQPGMIVQKGKPSYCTDGKEIATSNWMRYINCANNDEQQNLTAFQYRGEIFYRTLKTVVPGQELLVWYGKDFAKVLGLDPNAEGSEEGSDVDARTKRSRGSRASDSDHNADQLLEMLPSTCFMCSFVTLEVATMKNHLMEHLEKSGQRLKCFFPQCSYTDSGKGYFKEHLYAHTDSKPFCCRECGARFGRKSNFVLHTARHRNSALFCQSMNRFKCDSCSQAFSSKAQLFVHMSEHHTEVLEASDATSGIYSSVFQLNLPPPV